jgi:Domain of unknown function (DUF4224)
MVHLSREEVADMCRPLVQPAAQIRYLQSIGIRVRRRPDGTPLVLRADLQYEAARESPLPWTR